MSLIYFVSTGNYLHRSKKFFDCFCQVIDHLTNIIDMSDDDLEMEDINQSYNIIRIDKEKCPDYGRLYFEKELQQPARKKADDKIIE